MVRAQLLLSMFKNDKQAYIKLKVYVLWTNKHAMHNTLNGTAICFCAIANHYSYQCNKYLSSMQLITIFSFSPWTRGLVPNLELHSSAIDVAIQSWQYFDSVLCLILILPSFQLLIIPYFASNSFVIHCWIQCLHSLLKSMIAVR